VRSRIVAADRPLLRLGFAAIHFDLGPVPSGDQAYLDLRRPPEGGRRVLPGASDEYPDDAERAIPFIGVHRC
jgi:hypothetical protein